MISRKHISQFLVVLMLAMQLVMAQHYSVHFAESGGLAAYRAHTAPNAPVREQGHHGAADDLCQICSFIKNFSGTAAPVAPVLPVVVFILFFLAPVLLHGYTPAPLRIYAARGPPV